MSATLESGDYVQTVMLAETITPEQIRASSRQTSYWMNYGRELARVRRRDDAALALRRAEMMSPDQVQRNPFVREVLAALLIRSRRDTSVGRELRRMAYCAGLSV